MNYEDNYVGWGTHYPSNDEYFASEKKEKRVFILRDKDGVVLGVYSSQKKVNKKIVKLALEGSIFGELVIDEYVVNHND